MDSNQEYQVIQFSIPSDFSHMTEVVDKTEEICRKFHFPNEEMQNLVVSVSEALSNAIVHGNKQDPEKNVSIKFSISDAKMSIAIKDEGDGFNLKKIPNPLKTENITKESGRGIFLLKELMDDVLFDFTSNGTEVTITKNIKKDTKELKEK